MGFPVRQQLFGDRKADVVGMYFDVRTQTVIGVVLGLILEVEVCRH